MTSDQLPERTGTVFDIGYQTYAGEREGRSRAWKTMLWDGVKNGMGIGRGGWAKFLPWLVLSPTIATGLVFAAIGAFFEQFGFDVDETAGALPVDLPGHLELTAVISFMILIFAAFVGPELVCPDRRNRVIHLYFVRPITLFDYLGARWCALFMLLLAAAVLPHITYWIGLLFGVADSLGHAQDNWLDIPRFVGNGIVFAIFTTSITIAISSMTDRRMIATLIVIAVFVISSFAELIVNLFDPPASISDPIALLNLIEINTGIMPSIFFGTYHETNDLSMFLPVAWVGLLTTVSIFATWRFYSIQR